MDTLQLRPQTTEEWNKIVADLSKPFSVEHTMFRTLRLLKTTNEYAVAAYVSRFTVIARLNAVVGPHNWDYDFKPLVMELVKQKITAWDDTTGQMETTIEEVTQMTKAKGVLTIYGMAGKASLGEASNMSPSKGCDSDTFKRAAAMWGLASYLYEETEFTVPRSEVKYSKISPDAIYRLRVMFAEKYSLEPPKQPANYREAQGNNQQRQSAPPQPQGPSRAELLGQWVEAVKNANLPRQNRDAPMIQQAIAEFLNIPLNKSMPQQLSAPNFTKVIDGVRNGDLKWQSAPTSEDDYYNPDADGGQN